MAAQAPNMVDRERVPPFLLRLFSRQGEYHKLDEFDPSLPRLPTHLQIYTWHNCTLRELCGLFLGAMPNLLPQPYAGTRIAFRLVYPNMQGSNRPGAQGRYTSRDIGSVIVGAQTPDECVGGDSATVTEALKQLDGDLDKTLGDARFHVGDFVACAILPPLPDGSVPAPPPPAQDSNRGPGSYGGRGRENGLGGRGDYGYGRGSRGGRYEDRRSFDDRRFSGGVPSGEWRRGEAPPEWDSGYGRGRGGGGPESAWHGRGRGRW